MGEMTDFIANWSYLDELDGEPYCKPQEITCKYCGKQRLYWKSTDAGWRLFTATGRMHSCIKHKQKTQTYIIKTGPTTFMKANAYPLLD